MQSNKSYLFKQAASFGKGLTYSLGVHRVPGEVIKHHYFQKLLKAGLVIETSAGAAGSEAGSPSRVDSQKRAIEAAKEEASKKLADAKEEDDSEEADEEEEEDEEDFKKPSKKPAKGRK